MPAGWSQARDWSTRGLRLAYTLTSLLTLRAAESASFLLTSRHVAAADALPMGSRIASFEIEAVIARGLTSFVYLAQDLTRGLPVAIKEYAPARRVGAAPNDAIDPLIQRGLQAFMAEARVLAACHHPSLVRVEALLDANGTAYRVMPFYKGLSLVHVRTGLGRAPDDATLRAWGADLVGALQAMHDTGHAHGGVSPENILLLADDRPLLFGAGSASHRVGSDLVESLLADFGLRGSSASHGEPDPKLIAAAGSTALPHDEPEPEAEPSAASPEAVADDMRALAAVLRFCISGEAMGSPVPPDTETLHVGDRPVAAATPPAQALVRESAQALVRESAQALVRKPAPAAVRKPAPAPVNPPAQADVPARTDASVQAPLPSRLFAQHAQLGGADHDNPDGDREPTFGPEPQADDWTATAPVPIASASTARPLIPVRWHIPLWVGLIGMVGVAVLGVMTYVMGAWNRMPPIDFDRSLQTATLPSTTPAASVPEQTPLRSRAESDLSSTAMAAPATAASEVSSRGVPLMTESRVAAMARPAAVATSTAKQIDNRTAQRAAKRVARKQVRKPAARPAQPAAAVKLTSPQAACGARTNFALERCMQNQCRSKRWASHPQCTSRAAA
jgi:serine/threonine protein kinase